MSRKISIIILCGGKSSRMGTDKGSLRIGNDTFLQRIIKNLLRNMDTNKGKLEIDEIVLAVGNQDENRYFDCENYMRNYEKIRFVRVFDAFHNCGPLGGMGEAFKACKNEIIYLVSCDMPNVDFQIAEELYKFLTPEIQAVIPCGINGKKHLLCGIYKKEIQKQIEEQKKKGQYQVAGMLEEVQVTYVKQNNADNWKGSFENINTPAEYRMLLKKQRNIPIITFAAFSGTGKTTFLVQLIPVLKRRGLRVAVVKHDAHEFNIDHEGKDSYKITQAGADITGLVSDRQSVLVENRKVEIEEFISKIDHVDVILMEGYKFGGWPKIMLHRKATGKPLPVKPEECLAVVSDVPIDYVENLYSWEEVEKIADVICKKLEVGRKES